MSFQLSVQLITAPEYDLKQFKDQYLAFETRLVAQRTFG